MLLALDISTRITGYSIFDDTGSIIKVSHISLREEDIFEKALSVEKVLKDIKNNYFIDEVWIESSLNVFTRGKSSANTLSTLTRFNGVVSHLCFQVFQKKPNFIGAISARSKVGIKVPRGIKAKEVVSEWVKENIPSYVFAYKKTGKPKDYCLDECDSLIIGLSALKDRAMMSCIDPK